MTKLEEVKQQIKNNVKWETVHPPKTGGQQCGMPRSKVKLVSEELDLEIVIGYHRSQLYNKEIAWTLFELTLDELVK